MKKIAKTFIFAACLLSTPAFAADANNVIIQDKDFSDVASLMNQMTPEQRAEIIKQAKQKEPSLQSLSPEEQNKLKSQLRDISSTIKMDEIDPKKLNASKGKDVGQITDDLNTYQKKYEAGKINNPAVKTHDADVQ